jgi:hypothetical protein
MGSQSRWVKGVLVALAAFCFMSAAAGATESGAAPDPAVPTGAAAVAPARELAADPFTSFANFLESTGPFGVAVLAGWWAWRKDREKSDLALAHNAQIREMYTQVVGIVGAQTAATTKMESAVSALKDAIVAVLNTREG